MIPASSLSIASSQGASNEGTYTISPEGVVDLVGYGLVNADGELTITVATAPNSGATSITPEEQRQRDIIDSVTRTSVSESRQATQGASGSDEVAPSLGINSNSGVTLLASLNTNGLVSDVRRQSPAEPELVANFTLSLAVSGSSAPVTFTQAGGAVTLSMGTGAVATEEVAAVGLPIFENQASGLVLDSVVDMRDSGSSLTSTPVEGAAASNLPSLETMNVVQQTQIELTQADGTAANLEVSVTDEGILVIELPEGVTLSDKQQISLLGAAAAKEMGVSVDTLRSIVVQRK